MAIRIEAMYNFASFTDHEPGGRHLYRKTAIQAMLNVPTGGKSSKSGGGALQLPGDEVQSDLEMFENGT